MLLIKAVSVALDYTSEEIRFFLELHEGNNIIDLGNFATLEEAKQVKANGGVR